MGKLIDVLPHLTTDQADEIREAIVSWIKRPIPRTFYVYPGWSQRDENFMFHGSFIKTFDDTGKMRGKIMRGNSDLPQWVNTLSRSILTQDLEMGIRMMLVTQNHPLVAVVKPAFSSPLATIKDFDEHHRVLTKNRPPEKLAACKTVREVLRRLILDHVRNAGLYIQEEDVAPNSGHLVTIALSQHGFVRVYVANESLHDKWGELVAGKRNPEKVFQGTSSILVVETLDDVISQIR